MEFGNLFYLMLSVFPAKYFCTSYYGFEGNGLVLERRYCLKYQIVIFRLNFNIIRKKTNSLTENEYSYIIIMLRYQHGYFWPSLSPPLPIIHCFWQVFWAIYPVSSQSCCMYVRARHPAFARPCERVHRSTSLTSSFLLLHQCPACLVRLILIVFVTGGRWPNSCCFVGCCLQDLFNIAHSILV